MEQALQLALWQRRIEQKAHVRPAFGTIHHSDAGSEYTSQVHSDAGDGGTGAVDRNDWGRVRQRGRRDGDGVVQERGGC